MWGTWLSFLFNCFNICLLNTYMYRRYSAVVIIKGPIIGQLLSLSSNSSSKLSQKHSPFFLFHGLWFQFFFFLNFQMKNWFFLSPAISKRNPVRKIKIYLIKLCKFNFKLTYKPPKPLKSPRKMIQTIDKKVLYISNSKCQSLPKCITTHLSVNKHPPKVNSFRKKITF